MAHERKRSIDELLRKLLGFSPVIGLFGHRQVGKTTLAASLSPSYWTLDDRDTRTRITQDPKAFLNIPKQKLPVIIDECQQEPDLFPALKEHIRTHRKPGQFILTGSVRFTSGRAGRESLAGRLSPLELYPLILSELEQEPLPEVLPILMKANRFSLDLLPELKQGKALKHYTKAFEKYLMNGGLPGLCFIREDRLRKERLAALHTLILDRDLRYIVKTKLSLETLRSWLRWISIHSFQSYNSSKARSEVGISIPTQKNLLHALESIYLIRRIPIKGGRSGEIVLLEDQFEERELSGGELSKEAQILSAFYRNARAQFSYRLGETVSFESYWTRDGARVPLVIRAGSSALGFIAISNTKPLLSQKRAADSFLRAEPQGKILFISSEARAPEIKENRILICSAASLI